MISYCVIFNRKVLPTIRAMLAVKLVEEYGLSQVEVAKYLGVRQSLVNYVVTGKRKAKYMDKIAELDEMNELVDKLSKEIALHRRSPNLCEVCEYIFSNNLAGKLMKAVGEERVILPSSRFGGKRP